MEHCNGHIVDLNGTVWLYHDYMHGWHLFSNLHFFYIKIYIIFMWEKLDIS